MWWRFGKIRSVCIVVPNSGSVHKLKTTRGHCLGDTTVQCCLDQLTNLSQTSYNSPGVYHNGVQQINNPETDRIVVLTVEGSGTQPSYSTSGNQGVGNGVEVPSVPTSEIGRDTSAGKEPAVRESQNRSRALVGAITVNANDESGKTPTNQPSEKSRPSNYGLQPDGTFVVPTVPQEFETPREALEWQIIPGVST